MTMKKQYAITALGAILLASCADTWDRVYESADPDMPEYEYLNAYAPLKENIDRAKHPIFKAGVALAASEFNKQELVYSLAKANFDEIVAGNAMKMASCVDDKGNMTFDEVVSFVNNADDAGLSVYGHTLAWHSQQPVKYLTSLIADKKIEVDPDAKVEKEDYNWDMSTVTACPGWNGSPEGPVFTWGTPDGLMVENAAPTANFWDLQYHAANGVTLEAGQSYTATFTLKCEGSAPCTFRYKFGNWSAGASGEITVEPGVGFKDYEVKFPAAEGTEFLLLQHGDFVGTLWVKNIRVTHQEAPAVEIPETVYSCTFDDGNNLIGWGGASTREVVDGEGLDGSKCHVIHNPSAVNTWEVQAAIDFDTPLTEGETYYLRYWARSNGTGNIEPAYQNPVDYSGRGGYGALKVSSEWQKFEGKTVITGDNCKRLCFSVGTIAGDIYIDDVEIYVMKTGNTIPQTPEEKKANLTPAMQNWIAGMINATDGKVKAWDLVNEAISGGNADGEGVYALQHATDQNSGSWDVGGTAFFWQDYLGDIDYIRIAEAAARKAWADLGKAPDDLKLFINDYNLESDWDTNGKVKSLVKWIARWEADGKTKIDGIGTQMHISFYANEGTRNSKKAAIEEMFRIMAATGKYVRVSELDMGYVDINNRILTTAEIESSPNRIAIEKEMAAYYQWIIEKYFEIVPAKQQWGICQWCITDAPADSGWRGGEPVGLWNKDYQRKPAYGGWAEGLKK